MLIFHLSDELGGLKQILARPDAAGTDLRPGAIVVVDHAGLEVS